MHSPIGGSNASIWGECALYVTMTADLAPRETEDTLNGNAAHDIASDLIICASRGQARSWADYEGGIASNGVPFTLEMFEAAQVYADYVVDVMRSEGVFGGENLLIEQSLAVPAIHSAAFGTPDAAIYKPGKLYIPDFKFGHRHVDVFENKQLTFYAAGLLDHFGIDGLKDQHTEVEFVIVSPRVYRAGGPIHTWTVKASDLRGAINKLHTAAHAQFVPNPVGRSGPHCYDCEGRTRCPVATRAGMDLYETAMTATPDDMPPEAKGLQLSIIERAIGQLEALKTGLSQEVELLIREEGTGVPGWMLEPTYGRETWATSVENAVAIGRAYNVDISKPGVKTPNQAIKAGLPADVVKSLTETPKRGLKLVPDDGTLVKRIFNNG